MDTLKSSGIVYWPKGWASQDIMNFHAIICTVCPQYLTLRQTSDILDQFSGEKWQRNQHILWSGVDYHLVKEYADEHDEETLKPAMGPLMDPKNPACLKNKMTSKDWGRYIRGASALYSWRISHDPSTTVLTQPPPNRLNPSGRTNYQAVEEPILRGLLGSQAVGRIRAVHPTIQKAKDSSYNVWPVDEKDSWMNKFGSEKVPSHKWRKVNEKTPQPKWAVCASMPEFESREEKEPHPLALFLYLCLVCVVLSGLSMMIPIVVLLITTFRSVPRPRQYVVNVAKPATDVVVELPKQKVNDLVALTETNKTVHDTPVTLTNAIVSKQTITKSKRAKIKVNNPKVTQNTLYKSEGTQNLNMEKEIPFSLGVSVGTQEKTKESNIKRTVFKPEGKDGNKLAMNNEKAKESASVTVKGSFKGKEKEVDSGKGKVIDKGNGKGKEVDNGPNKGTASASSNKPSRELDKKNTKESGSQEKAKKVQKKKGVCGPLNDALVEPRPSQQHVVPETSQKTETVKKKRPKKKKKKKNCEKPGGSKQLLNGVD